MTQLSDELYSVEASDNYDAKDIVGRHITAGVDIKTGERLPPGEWQILGTCSPTEITFDVEPLVESDIIFMPDDANLVGNDYEGELRYRDYNTGYDDYYRADDSFRSLLQSKLLDSTKKYLIIKKIKRYGNKDHNAGT